jgi:YCII-related domain
MTVTKGPAMKDYMLLMHDDAAKPEGDWAPYFRKLEASGHFEGGSGIDDRGICMVKSGTPKDITGHLIGYIVIQAPNITEAKKLVIGNPVYEAGGTVEIRELPQD